MLWSTKRLRNIIGVMGSSKIRPVGQAEIIYRKVQRGYGLEKFFPFYTLLSMSAACPIGLIVLDLIILIIFSRSNILIIFLS